jgi:hypothetical protein
MFSTTNPHKSQYGQVLEYLPELTINLEDPDTSEHTLLSNELKKLGALNVTEITNHIDSYQRQLKVIQYKL